MLVVVVLVSKLAPNAGVRCLLVEVWSGRGGRRLSVRDILCKGLVNSLAAVKSVG